MARRTLTTCWKQYEKLTLAYLDGEKSKRETMKKLVTLTKKTNQDKIGNALVTLFVQPHIGQKIELEFAVSSRGRIPDWQTSFDAKKSKIIVDTLSTFNFIKSVREIEVPELTEKTFIQGRYVSFLAEIGKLNTIYILSTLISTESENDFTILNI